MAHRALWLCLIALLLFPACGDDGGVVPQETPIDVDHEIQQGWALFRARDFTGAAIHFRLVVQESPDAADGYIGLGWCEIEADSLSRAYATLETATRLDDDPDGLAGIAVAASALGRDSVAVAAASSITDTGYLFTGDQSFGYTDLVYIRALGEFHLRRYEECCASLRILKPDLVIDLDAYYFREQIFIALSLLRGRV